MKIDLDAIIKIESDGDPKAFNEKSGARGLCQITPICLEEYNSFHKEAGSANLEDLFNPRVNRFIADWYLNTRIPAMLQTYAIPLTVENVLIAYNWGIGNLKKLVRHEGHPKLPEETANYIKKYRELTK